jgi:phosphoribosylanthranilate isomerase
MSVRIKICGLTDAAGVNAAVAAGVDAVGFVFFEKSPRNLNIGQAIELAALVPDQILTVAVMLHPEAAFCDAVLAGLSPDIVQTDASDFAYLNVPGHIERWEVLRESGVDDQTRLPKRFVYEGDSSGQGDKVDWQNAARISAQGEMILAGGLDATNVADAIREVRPWAVDISSGVESAPGKKDTQKIDEFVAAVRAVNEEE